MDRSRLLEHEPEPGHEAVDAPEPGTLPDPKPVYGERGYEPTQPSSGLRALLRKLLAPLTAVGVFLLKFGGILLKLKVLTTAGSMLVSIAAYAWIFGWPFAVGLVALIFVHEMGHVVELRRQGVPASAPLFIPFLGAVVGMKQLPDDAWKEARVALAGPIVGSVGAAAVLGVAEATGSDLLKALAFFGFFINLFNLIPIVPLDGGRAVAALHPAVWLVGWVMVLALAALRPNPILFLIVILGGLELWRRWRERGDRADYYRLSVRQRIEVAVVYIGLILVLALAVAETHVARHF